MEPEVSLFEPSASGASLCGYCNAAEGCISTGFWAHRLRADDFQLLLDAGWRRSGRLIYRPDNARTCCPCVAAGAPSTLLPSEVPTAAGLTASVCRQMPSARLGSTGGCSAVCASCWLVR